MSFYTLGALFECTSPRDCTGVRVLCVRVFCGGFCVWGVCRSSSSGHSAGDGHTCLGQTPACRTHPKARLHLQAALNVKIICSHPQFLGYSQPWLPCDFPWGKGSGRRGQSWGSTPGPARFHTPCPPLAFTPSEPAKPWPGLHREGGILALAFYFLGLLLLDYRTQWEDWVA